MPGTYIAQANIYQSHVLKQISLSLLKTPTATTFVYLYSLFIVSITHNKS